MLRRWCGESERRGVLCREFLFLKSLEFGGEGVAVLRAWSSRSVASCGMGGRGASCACMCVSVCRSSLQTNDLEWNRGQVVERAGSSVTSKDREGRLGGLQWRRKEEW